MLYIVRHCKAAGQQPEAALTAEGHLQAVQLAERLNALPIERVISSPFLRGPVILPLFQAGRGTPAAELVSVMVVSFVQRPPTMPPIA